MEENGMNPEMQNAPETETSTAAPEVETAAPEAEVKMSFIDKVKANMKLLIGAGAALAAVIVAVIVVSAILSSPKVVFSNAISGAVKGFVKRDEIAPIVSMLKHGSLAVDAEIEPTEDEKIELGGKVYFSNKSIFFSDIVFDNGDMALEGSAYFSLDYMYVNSDKILGGAYGFVAGDSESSFKNSVFAEKDGDYELPEDSQTMVANYLRGYDEDIYNEMYKDANKLIKKYEKKLKSLVSKYGEFEKETTKMKVDGERKNVRLVTLTITQDALVEIMEELYFYVETDSKLEDFFIEYADFFEEALIASGNVDEDFDAQEAYDDFLEEFEKYVDELDDSSKDDISYVIKVATPKSSSKLIKLTVSMVDDDDEEELYVVEAGSKGVKKTDKLVIKNGNTTYTYEIKDDSMSAYKASLVHEYDSEWSDDYDYEETVLSIDIDKKKDKVKIGLNDGDTVLKGTFKSNLFNTKITIDSITVGEEKLDKANISVTLNKFDFVFLNKTKLDEAEVMPIDELKAEDIEKIGEKIYKEEESDEDDIDW
ncbi:MAG: hypothetical protein IJW03_05700 [Clostridia bacterium]|nr:hypothetical protein [Clostridia bacterium]